MHNKFFVILGFLLLTGLLCISCDNSTDSGNSGAGNGSGVTGNNGSGGGSGVNNFVGTWRTSIYGTTTTLTFDSNLSFLQSTSGINLSGRYTYSGNTATITFNDSSYGKATAVLSSGNTLMYGGYTYTK